MNCSRCDSEMDYEKTIYLPVSSHVDGWEPGFKERVDLWKCPKCGPKTGALNTIENLMREK